MRWAAVLVGLGGCLVSEAGEGEWAPLDRPCEPFAPAIAPIIRDQSMTEFVLAGDSLLFDTDGGIAQLRGGKRTTIAHVDELTTQEFHVVGNELVYYDWSTLNGDRILVRDRGARANPRFERFASIAGDSITVIALPSGMYWRYLDRGGWKHWSPATDIVTDFELGRARSVFTDGHEFFYKLDDTLATVPVDGGTPAAVATVDDTTIPLGITDGRLFVHRTDTGDIYELARDGSPTRLATIPTVGVPSNYGFGGGYFYWSPIEDGLDHIYRISLSSGHIEAIATLADGAIVGRLATDACNVYWRVIADGAPTEVWARGH